MEDQAILELYWSRVESAISETAAKYGNYCYRIAYNILNSREDSEESVNDTWMAAWKSIPPQKPNIFSAFLGKITRHISLDRWRLRTAGKRGGGEVSLTLEELGECLPGGENAEQSYIRRELLESIDQFLETLPEAERKVFVCRYWYMEPVAQIARHFAFSQSKVSSMLHRTRAKLRAWLEEEGFG